MQMTRAEIMRRAHEIARQMEGDYRARLVYGLRQAWREARRPALPELQGTPRQVAWAVDIRDAFLRDAEDQVRAGRAYAEIALERARLLAARVTSAKWWIEHRGLHPVLNLWTIEEQSGRVARGEGNWTVEQFLGTDAA